MFYECTTCRPEGRVPYRISWPVTWQRLFDFPLGIQTNTEIRKKRRLPAFDIAKIYPASDRVSESSPVRGKIFSDRHSVISPSVARCGDPA